MLTFDDYKRSYFYLQIKVSAICECVDEFQNKIFQIKAYERTKLSIYF